jgi:hypothetical protein
VWRSLHWSGTLKTVAGELVKLVNLMGVMEVSWDKGGTESREDYNFLYGTGNQSHQL